MPDKHKLKVGDSITVFIPSAFGARNAMDFIVLGIYRASAPWWDEGITIRAQDYITMSELGDAFPFYKVYVKDERAIPGMVRELSLLAKDFKVKGYRDDQFVRFLLGLGMSNVLMFGCMAMIIFLALLIGIRSVILTNIFDRRDEIGTLRALGFRRGTVRNLFFGESLAALLLGYLLGAGFVALVGWWFSVATVQAAAFDAAVHVRHDPDGHHDERRKPHRALPSAVRRPVPHDLPHRRQGDREAGRGPDGKSIALRRGDDRAEMEVS